MLLQGLLSLALAGVALAAPAGAPADGKPTWTLTNFARTCNDGVATCRYSFGISKSTQPSVITPCAFTVQGFTGSARSTDFQDKICEGALDFHVNGGWDSKLQFITLVVTEYD
jgi:hypothetical protein